MRVVLPFLLLAPSIVVAQTEAKKNAIDNLASILVAEKWCTDYIVDMKTIAIMLKGVKIDLNKDADTKLIYERREYFEKLMGSSGASSYCSYAYKIFGPGGEIPGVMMKK